MGQIDLKEELMELTKTIVLAATINAFSILSIALKEMNKADLTADDKLRALEQTLNTWCERANKEANK